MATRNGSSSRRKWLLQALIGVVSATAAGIAFPVLAFLRPRRQLVAGGLEVVAPYKVNQLERDANGEWPAPFDFGGKPCLLIKKPDGTVKAFNAVCTHLECTVTYRSDQQDIFCNCHNGVFNTDGQTVSGPPPKPLEEYDVTLRGEQIIVSRS